MSIENNINDIRKLNDGWLNGYCLAFDSAGLDWVLLMLQKYQIFEDMHIYPTYETNVIRLEKYFKYIDFDFEINIETRSGTYYFYDCNTNYEESDIVNLSTTDAWELLVKKIESVEKE